MTDGASRAEAALAANEAAGALSSAPPDKLSTACGEWLYHVTNRSIAASIQKDGLRSALLRTGQAVAHPDGAFARNRDAMWPGKVNGKLRGYVADLLFRGHTEEEIEALAGRPYTPPPVPETRDSGADYEALEAWENEQLEACADLLDAKKAPQKKGRAYYALYRSKPVQELAEKLGADHPLAKLAEQHTARYYRIEETNTASHVYLLRPEYASVGFNQYKKGIDETDLVVLRVAKGRVPGLEDDSAEQMAMRTKAAIPPASFQVMSGPKDFGKPEARDDAERWIPLPDWAPGKS